MAREIYAQDLIWPGRAGDMRSIMAKILEEARNEICAEGILSNEMMKRIADEYRTGDEDDRNRAGEFVIRQYKDSVGRLIRMKYSTFHARYREDLEEAGYIGLIKALGRYGLNGKPSCFLTFSRFYVLHEMSREAATILQTGSDYYARIQRDVKNVIKARCGDDLDRADISVLIKETGYSEQIVRRAVAFLKATRFVYMDEEEGMIMQVHDNGNTPEEEFCRLEANHEIHKVVRTLPDEMRLIVTWRFALEGGEEMTFKAIGEKLGMDQGKVKRLLNSALSVLSGNDILRDFYATWE